MTTIFDTHKIDNTDVIFASVMCNGKTLVRITQSNFNSIEEVMQRVISMAGKFMGVVRVRVRNMTQGWSTGMAIASQRRITSHALTSPVPAAPAMRSGTQYTIPW